MQKGPCRTRDRGALAVVAVVQVPTWGHGVGSAWRASV